MRAAPLVLLTGATGLLGAVTLERLLARGDRSRIAVLVRSPERWAGLAARLGAETGRVEPVVGDITRDGLAIDRETRMRLQGRVRLVVHLAADTTFSRPLEQARAVNTRGTQNVLALADQWAAERVVHVSTAFVAGTVTGFVGDDHVNARGWVNGYEQSKFEAESLVRSQRVPWTILRPSTIVCDDVRGHVTQLNAVHRALRLCRAGLASMLPGSEGTLVDCVPASWVADAVVRAALSPDFCGRSLHLCAGERALPLGELLDRTWVHWAREPEWRRRAIDRPVLTDLTTYRLFEDAIRDSADPRLARVVSALSHFVPQLALPKRFDDRGGVALAGTPAPAPSTYWAAMLDHLQTVVRETRQRSVA